MDPSNTEMVTQNGKQVPAKYPVFYTYAEYEFEDVWAGQADDQRDQTLEFQGKAIIPIHRQEYLRSRRPGVNNAPQPAHLRGASFITCADRGRDRRAAARSAWPPSPLLRRQEIGPRHRGRHGGSRCGSWTAAEAVGRVSSLAQAAQGENRQPDIGGSVALVEDQRGERGRWGYGLRRGRAAAGGCFGRTFYHQGSASVDRKGSYQWQHEASI